MFGLNSVMKVINIIYERARKEYLDEDNVKKALLNLSLQYDMGEMSYEEYKNQEEQLIQRIKEIREYKKQLIEEGELDHE